MAPLDTSDWSSQLKRGVLELCILQVLRDDPSYGYEIVTTLDRFGPLAAGENTVYPLLRRLKADGVLETFLRESPSGPPRQYYQLELLVSPRPSAPPQPRSDRWLRIAGLLAIGSLPTLIIVITLGSIGIAFTFSGVAVIIAGIAAMAGSLPSWATLTIEPWLAIVLGVVMTGLGIFSTGATLAYLRFVVRVVRRVVPARAPAAA